MTAPQKSVGVKTPPTAPLPVVATVASDLQDQDATAAPARSTDCSGSPRPRRSRCPRRAGSPIEITPTIKPPRPSLSSTGRCRRAEERFAAAQQQQKKRRAAARPRRRAAHARRVASSAPRRNRACDRPAARRETGSRPPSPPRRRRSAARCSPSRWSRARSPRRKTRPVSGAL